MLDDRVVTGAEGPRSLGAGQGHYGDGLDGLVAYQAARVGRRSFVLLALNAS